MCGRLHFIEEWFKQVLMGHCLVNLGLECALSVGVCIYNLFEVF